MALLSTDKRNEYLQALGFKDVLSFQKKAFKRKQDIDGIYGQDTDNALRTWYNVYKYTKNFKPEEFRCECGKYCCGYPAYMRPEVLSALQAIRSHWKKPITVTCGLRCSGYNRALNGSISNSSHLTGLAVDFYEQGVTDTLANRKSSIKWIKKLANFNYAYGNGINSVGSSTNAPYMGNALHIDFVKGKVEEPKENKAAKSEPNKIVDVVNLLAHPYKTDEKKWKYDTGAPTMEFRSASKKYTGKDKKIQLSDCGNFIDVVVRKAGVDKDFVTLKGTKDKFPKSDKFKVVHQGKVPKDFLKAGDIIRYKKTDGTQHALIFMGSGKIAEAGRGKRFPVIRKSTKYNGSKVKFDTLEVLRVK